MIKKKTGVDKIPQHTIENKNSNDITEDNVEEIVDKAINTYFSSGRIVDALFWRTIIRLLKSKYSKKLGEPI